MSGNLHPASQMHGVGRMRQRREGAEARMLGLAPAPELCRTGVQWFNVTQPLSLNDLRGRLVILDFWTPCCVNCLHVLPTLRRLEEAFAESSVVVGVHSPNYPA